MNELPEHVGKSQFEAAGIPTPHGQVISETPDGADAFSVDPPAVVKAQLPVTGRGKKGGIIFAETTSALIEGIDALLDSRLGDKRVESVLVEEKLQCVAELYLSFSADGSNEGPTLTFSTRGGQDVESTDAAHVASRLIDPLAGVYPYHVREVQEAVTDDVSVSSQELYRLLRPAWNLFQDLDLRLLEINPVGVTRSGDLYALDAKFVVDDAARFRQSHEHVRTTLADIEQRAGEDDIDLRVGNGTIGIVSNGAGLALATMDCIADTTETTFSGTIDTHGARFEEEHIETSLRYLAECGSRSVIVNIQGPIIDCLSPARAVIGAVEDRYELPVVALFKGYNETSARRECEAADIVTVSDVPEAVSAAARLREVPK